MTRPACTAWFLSAAAAFMLLPACSSSSSGSSGHESAETYGVEVPSEDEARREAESEIHDSNADAEFDKLMKEVDDDLAKSDG